MMSMSPITFLSDVLGGESVPKGKLAYFRARLSNLLHEVVLKRFMELERDEGFTRADLARRIGRKPEQVTRWLGSPGNWTLETVSDLLAGMGCELRPEVVELSARADGQVQRYLTGLNTRMRRGTIDAINQPVTATFNKGQMVYLFSVPSEEDSAALADQSVAEGLISAYGVIGVESPGERIVPLETRGLGQIASRAIQQNPLPTDAQGQRALQGDLA
jgi:hypothetical protein